MSTSSWCALSDGADRPALTPEPATPARRWRIQLAGSEVRTVQAHSFRCEAGALVLVLPAGCVAAYAPGQWHLIEPEGTTP